MLSVAVLVLGLAITAGAALAAALLYHRTEHHLVELRTRDAGLVLSAVTPALQSRLAEAADLAASARVPATGFDSSLASVVGRRGSGAEFVGASLYRLDGGAVRRVAVLGISATPGDPAALLRTAARTHALAVSGLVGGPRAPMIAYAAVPAGGHYGVFALGAIRADRRVSINASSPFAGFQFALYLGTTATPAALLESSVAAAALPAGAARVTIPFGTNHLLLLLASPSPLAGTLFADLWWIAAGVGALTSLAGALLVERLVRRQEAAAANAERLARLQATAIALGGAMFHDDVQAAVTELAVPAAGANAGALMLRSGNGRQVEVLASVGYPPEVLAEAATTIDSPRPMPTAVRTGEMVLVADASTLEVSGQFAAGAAPASLAALPLRVQGRCIGALGLSFAERQSFDRTQVAFFESLVRHLASALERTRLHEETMLLLADRTEIAEGLQQSLLPPRLPELPGVALAARYRPSGGSAPVGGDFYDAFALGADRWLLVVGDVEGRGVEAAAVTGLVRHALRALMGTGMAPSAALAQVNRLLLAQDAGRRAPSRFCTAAVAVLDLSAAEPRLTLALAGHPAPLRADADGRVATIGRHGSLLGVQESARFSDETLTLHGGDTLVLFSDGVTERRSASGEFFGEENLAASVLAAPAPSAEAIADTIETAVRNFSVHPLSDDVAILVLSVPAPISRAERATAARTLSGGSPLSR